MNPHDAIKECVEFGKDCVEMGTEHVRETVDSAKEKRLGDLALNMFPVVALLGTGLVISSEATSLVHVGQEREAVTQRLDAASTNEIQKALQSGQLRNLQISYKGGLFEGAKTLPAQCAAAGENVACEIPMTSEQFQEKGGLKIPVGEKDPVNAPCLPSGNGVLCRVELTPAQFQNAVRASVTQQTAGEVDRIMKPKEDAVHQQINNTANAIALTQAVTSGR
ncbi:MAG: hypothetical protein PW734_04900 [Verrucomicrobium sp.]|nr:hypothetical protein [Verrucomicrobium sp.]